MAWTNKFFRKRDVVVIAGFSIMQMLALGLQHLNKKRERQSQIRNLIYSSLPNVTALCKSNAVTSAELFAVSEDRVFLCYEIDKRFYCLQQTGQLLNFQDKEFAIKAIKPRSVRCLYNIDKSMPQSPDEISSWMIKEEYLLQDTSHNLGDAKGGPHGH